MYRFIIKPLESLSNKRMFVETEEIMRNYVKGFTLIEVLMVFAIISLICFFAFPTGMWVSEKKAITALETQGFSNIKITHRAIWFIEFRGGDKSDAVRFTATATNPAGKPVTVYVFSGWIFKGATIRNP